jgi:hypothetical protein
MLEIASIFGLLHLHVTNFFQFIVVDENAWESLRQFRLGFLSLIWGLEANKSTGEVGVRH